MTDQTTSLRDRIAAALAEAEGWQWAPGYDKTASPTYQDFLRQADAVLAVLPAPVNLRAVAQHIEDHKPLPERGLAFIRGAEWVLNLLRRMADQAADELRRVADETAATETQAHAPLNEWRVEILDSDEWMPASGLRRDRSQAVEQLRMSSERRPLWKDGTRVQRRLVRETTTYTVEAETGTAAGARQDGAQR